MIVKNKNIVEKINNVNRRQLNSNTQKVFLSLVSTKNKDGWVARTSLNVPSVAARIRDLRKEQYGGFKVEFAKGKDIKRPAKTAKTNCQTYYRLVPRSITAKAVKTVLKGVI